MDNTDNRTDLPEGRAEQSSILLFYYTKSR